MSRIRFALAQINPVVGDLAGNSALIRAAVKTAADAKASVVALPEMALTGYPIEDLAFSPDFVDASRAAVEKLAAQLQADGLGDVAVIVGYIERAATPSFGGAIAHNALAVLVHGRIESRYFKQHLPNYSVFDEERVFVPGESTLALVIGGVKVGMLVCEDLWRDEGPVRDLASQDLDVVVVINASPFDSTKVEHRFPLIQRRHLQPTEKPLHRRRTRFLTLPQNQLFRWPRRLQYHPLHTIELLLEHMRAYYSECAAYPS